MFSNIPGRSTGRASPTCLPHPRVPRWSALARRVVVLLVAGALSLTTLAPTAAAQPFWPLPPPPPGHPAAPAPLGDLPGPGLYERTLRATVDQIVDTPLAYYGLEVAVTGDVGDVLGPRSFRLIGADPLFDAEIPVVVVGPLRNLFDQPISVRMLTNRPVRVIGTVHRFDLIRFENDLDLDLNDANWLRYTGRPAIVASAVTPLVTSGEAAVITQPGAESAVRARALPVSVDNITDNPAAFYGLTVQVTGQLGDRYHAVTMGRPIPPVEFSPRFEQLWAFTLEDGDLFFDDEVLVLSPEPVRTMFDVPVSLEYIDTLGDPLIRVVGTVRPFSIAAFEREFGVDLIDANFEIWEGEPYILTQESPTIDPAEAPEINPGL